VARVHEEKGEPDTTAGTRAGAKGGATDAPAGWADLDFVRGLIEVVDASGIDSVEISRAGTRVKISKSPPSPGGAAYFAPPAYAAPGWGSGQPGGAFPAPGGNAGPNMAPVAPAPGGPAAGESSSAPPLAGEAAEAAEASGLIEVKSPMVGTFYRAPAPEAPPYVEVGSRVTKGQTLCILEAMKLMNELESDVEGVVRQVLVENAEPVEYGQVLFRIDPNG
jgi:acetyl-CoA carboxylase biotin carboxyl carrier protein